MTKPIVFAYEFNADPNTLDDTDYVPNTYERSDLEFAFVPLDPFLTKRKLCLPPVPLLPTTFLAGGYVANLVNGANQAGDIDLFFPNGEALALQVNALLKDGFEPAECDKEVINAYSKWLKPGEALDEKAFVQFYKQVDYRDYTVQCVKIQYFTDVEHVLDCFDFTCVQFGVDLKTRELVFNPVSGADWAARRIVQHRVENTEARIRKRVEKYMNKGFTPAHDIIYTR